MRRGGARTAIVAAVAAVLLVCAAVLAWSFWPRSYDRSTPEALLASARTMVRQGRAEDLTSLVYTDEPRLRRVLDRLGSALGRLDDLGGAVSQAYPQEVADLRAKTAAAVASGKASSLITRAVTGQLGGQQRGATRPPRQEREQEFREGIDATVKGLMADPYGWLVANENRLGLQFISDDERSLTLDGRLLFPPIGIQIRKIDGRWHVAPPWELLQRSGAWPKTDEEWRVLDELAVVIDNMVMDMVKDVRARKHANLLSLAEETGERAFLPMAFAMIAFGRAVEDRRDDATQEQQQNSAQSPAGPG